MSCTLVAGGAGVKPFSSSFARTNASIGLRTHSACFTLGTSGRFTGLNDQKERACSGVGTFGRPSPFAATRLPGGNGAPMPTHFVSVATASGGNLVAEIG